MQIELKPQDTKTFVTFETLALPNPKESKKAGRPIFDDVEVCRIRFPGNKSTAGVYPAHEVFKQGPDQFGFVGDVTYAMEYQSQYLAFKTGAAQVQSGTPLSELPFLTAGKRLELKALNIHTAEVLAGLDGVNLKNLGPGGRDWKNQAIAWLEVANRNAGESHLNEALAAQNLTIDDLKAQLAQLTGAQAPAAAEEAEEAAANSTSTSAFKDWTTADILAWIKDRSPETVIYPSWKRSKVIAVADELEAANN